jgi:ubiquinone biosynthesis protein COQ4
VTRPRVSHRIRPLVAWRALRELLRNPDDTSQVFRIVEALSGRTGERVFTRFRRDPTGARILRERRSLLDTLTDREALLALPPGSLGRSYAEFTEREQISADGLVDASRARGEVLDAERRLVFDRLRDGHDLWHVVTGYGRDLIGEAALLAFSFAQTRNPGIGLIVAMAFWKTRHNAAFRELLRGGWRRGRRAAWLPAADWEALLPLPLDEVRARLGVQVAPRYEPVRSAGAPELAGVN